jgi:hypothetical protein
MIDQRIAELQDWRGETLARMRRLIRQADPKIIEEWKWWVPVWSRDGIICTGETYKSVVKLTFARGAQLKDPAKLFNSSLGGATRRAIDIPRGAMVDATAFKALVRAAVALNGGKAPKRTNRATGARRAGRLSGGNPQIAKADGDTAVQAYIAAMPGWKRDVGRRLDALIARTVPRVRKAVKWNSPFYGIADRGWFLSFHTFAKYVKVTFFRGTSMRDVPPGGTQKDARWVDIHEDDFDERRLRMWIRQAAAIPGWDGGSRRSGGVPL